VSACAGGRREAGGVNKALSGRERRMHWPYRWRGERGGGARAGCSQKGKPVVFSTFAIRGGLDSARKGGKSKRFLWRVHGGEKGTCGVKEGGRLTCFDEPLSISKGKKRLLLWKVRKYL